MNFKVQMVQMTLKMSLPVALGEGSEPLSQADWNVTYHCQETHIFTESSEKISVRITFGGNLEEFEEASQLDMSKEILATGNSKFKEVLSLTYASHAQGTGRQSVWLEQND